MDDDPWATDIPDRYQPGQLVKGKVTKITNFGVFVGLEDGLEGLLHISELADHKVENPEDVVKVGDEIEVKILRVDADERKIGLSPQARRLGRGRRRRRRRVGRRRTAARAARRPNSRAASAPAPARSSKPPAAKRKPNRNSPTGHIATTITSGVPGPHDLGRRFFCDASREELTALLAPRVADEFRFDTAQQQLTT